MDRAPLYAAPSSRRWITGVALVAAVWMVTLIGTSNRTSAAEPVGGPLTFDNENGTHTTISKAGSIDTGSAFFQDLGTNGRSCATCHQPAQAWTVTPADVQTRFVRTGGFDPIFRTNDGSNCEGVSPATLDERRLAFSLLLTKGLIRIGLDVPAGAEFEIVQVDDPYDCGTPYGSASLYRRPLPAVNLAFLSSVMWDGRQTGPGQPIREGLINQARDAVTRHAQGTPPSAATLVAIVDFELGLVTAQTRDRFAGGLNERGARGGPRMPARQPFCIGINDPLRMLPAVPGTCEAPASDFDPNVFRLFGSWASAPSAERQAIARGEAIFNTREFAIDNVPGLNGGPEDPVSGPIQNGTCTVCHDTPNAGNHSVAMALNIGIADADRRTPDLPLFTLRHIATGAMAQTTDPGRAMVTGRWNDIGKFKGPVLRALAARQPYFHDGSAATLGDVIAFYDKRFRIGLSEREKADLIAFLQAL